jgi:hypothetical protein
LAESPFHELQLVWVIEAGVLVRNGRSVLMTKIKKEKKKKMEGEKQLQTQTSVGAPGLAAPSKPLVFP